MNTFSLQATSYPLRQSTSEASKLQTNQGFTLVEITISLAVMTLLTAMLFSGLSSSKNNQALSTGVEIILSALGEARTKTLSSENNQSYGVYLRTDKVVIFPGAVFSEQNPLNQEFKLENPIYISTTSLAVSTSTLLFLRVTGEVANYGTITVSLKSDANQKRIINVPKTGAVSGQ